MKKNNKVTIYDISKKLNISAATVSRAMNNNARISAKTRKLVKETAKKMNYNQNRLAQALKSGRSSNVGVIVPFLNHNLFSSVIRGIEEELNPHGYNVIICQTHEKVKNEIEQIKTLLNIQVDGIFLSVSKTTRNTEHFEKVLAEKIPLIFFDRRIEVSGLSSVTIDDFKGGYLATEHLILNGCRKIAHLAGELHLEIYQKRYEGYKAALEDYNVAFKPEYVIKTDGKIEAGKIAVKTLWSLEEKPDGIFSAGDYSALGAIKQLKELGKKIPEEVCVVGFSNEPFTKYLELPITSVTQSPLKMGKVAANVFLEQMEHTQTYSIEKKVVLVPELCIRASSNRKNVLTL